MTTLTITRPATTPVASPPVPLTLRASHLSEVLAEAGRRVADLAPDDGELTPSSAVLAQLVATAREVLGDVPSAPVGDDVPWVVRVRELSVVGRRLLAHRDQPVPPSLVGRAQQLLAELAR